MPQRRKTYRANRSSKPTRKTTGYRKKAYSKRKTVVPRTMVTMGKGFPKKICMTHKYCEISSLTSTAGSLAKQSFSCNSMYDPNASLGGHQPLYRDQAAALYNHYTVIGSKITVRAINGANNTGLIGVALFINDDTTVVPTIIENVVEQSQSQNLKIIPYGSSNPVTLTSKWSAKKFFGKSPLANNSLGAAIGSNPAEQSYFTIVTQCMDYASSVVIYYEVEIEYICVWTELADVAAS